VNHWDHVRTKRPTVLLALLLSSIVAYGVHYALFHNGRDIFYYLLMDVAFLFIQVLLMTVVIERLLSARERQAVRKKVNVVLGVFFSQVGTPLIKLLGSFDEAVSDLARHLHVGDQATTADFAAMRAAAVRHVSRIDAERGDLAMLRAELLDERNFLMRLLEHPSLLEHDAFTELLWAIFHLAEELAQRPDLSYLPDPDRKHIETDISRAYHLLLREWIDYVQHLQSDYPYLFSLAVRTNPFAFATSVPLEAGPTTPAAIAN
jgi:hypothetical protein